MKQKANINDIATSFIILTIPFLFVGWQLQSSILLFCSFLMIAAILVLEAVQAYLKNDKYAFSQQLLRGIGIILITCFFMFR
ncbi:hypothetical protein F9U64_18280 [Gracilibacillus oryzae]|uniref:Phosphatidate cytidylyltransferase n=1 Tax=Gracilibacillus oryzae TaxID=1672701 RepID=A0A7C8KWC6_9BACI|nr:hypothetical protein [Gracilibacillus oryzae]KAB8127145.1 hypothetical protein F9U64_18280 [Gracilibacillus oryzae]